MNNIYIFGAHRSSRLELNLAHDFTLDFATYFNSTPRLSSANLVRLVDPPGLAVAAKLALADPDCRAIIEIKAPSTSSPRKNRKVSLHPTLITSSLDTSPLGPLVLQSLQLFCLKPRWLQLHALKYPLALKRGVPIIGLQLGVYQSVLHAQIISSRADTIKSALSRAIEEFLSKER